MYVGLDVHKESITVTYAIDSGEVELMGRIGTSATDIDRLCKRLRLKARKVRVRPAVGTSAASRLARIAPAQEQSRFALN
ncbi:hypothetical protein BFF94_038000 [Burkholderia catarinensis]|nr:hypothetical protein BFF94_038000 [Burkholderia catarinensis]